MDGTEKRKLPVKLGKGELADKALELAAEWVEMKRLEAEKDAANAGWKEQIKKHDKTITEISTLIVSGAEEREVDCKREYDVAGGYVMRVWRMDTGETVVERPMTEEERERVRQGDLFPPAGSDVAPQPSKEEAANALVEVAKRAGDNVTPMTPKGRKDVH
jgi:hypothetical protein